jgi:DNA-directed RNA polymerase subunit RPC12/RpoP
MKTKFYYYECANCGAIFTTHEAIETVTCIICNNHNLLEITEESFFNAM